ncbi:MAG: hypothetical protein S4CHLAM37_15810 [Chlamydiia bacterium]|nr:hypothetical protein [Chlamydiia bacterium]
MKHLVTVTLFLFSIIQVHSVLVFQDARTLVTGTLSNPSLVINGSNQAVAAWETTATPANPYAKYDFLTDQWTPVATGSISPSATSNVVFNNSGQGLVVVYDATANNLKYDTFSNGEWSGTLQTISDTAIYLGAGESTLYLAINDDGNAMVAWEARPSGMILRNIYINFFNGSTWSNSVAVSENLPVNNTIIDIVLDSSNVGTIVWNSDADSSVVGRVVNGNTPTGSEMGISGHASGGGTLTLNPDGSVLCMWRSTISGNVRSSLKLSGGVFQTPSDISDTVTSNNAAYAISSLGVGRTAVAIWRDGSGPIKTSIFDGSSSWSPELQITAETGTPAGLTGDGAGNAVAFWVNASNDALYFSEYVSSSDSWTSEVAIGDSRSNTLTTADFVPYRASMNSAGSAMITWIDRVSNDVMYSIGFDLEIEEGIPSQFLIEDLIQEQRKYVPMQIFKGVRWH